MRKHFFPFLLLAMAFPLTAVYAQTVPPAAAQAKNGDTASGMPGDNLDLYAVLDLFQRSKTIEEFEKSLNLEQTGINNLDLNLDQKVDFIKVITEKDGDNFSFILQVDVSKDEKQDVAVILVSKGQDKKVTMQIVGDKDLYGKDYIVELKETVTPGKTPNPAYTGENPDTVTVPSKTTVVVVESTPIVQYVYSPVYVPYAPPYYYGYYPPYFTAFAVISIGMYWGHHAHYHHHYGYHGNTTVIHNHNTYNNYNRTRNSSNTVNHYRENGGYNRGSDNAGTRPSTQPSRPSTGTRPSTQPARPSTQPSTGPSGERRSDKSVNTTPANRGSGNYNRSSGNSRGTGSRGGGARRR